MFYTFFMPLSVEKLKNGSFYYYFICFFFSHIITGSYNNFFRTFSRQLGADLTLEASPDVAKPRTVLQSKKVGLGSRRKKDEISPDSLDYTKKILHTAWHPSENIIAVAATNNLYIFQDSRQRRISFFFSFVIMFFCVFFNSDRIAEKKKFFFEENGPNFVFFEFEELSVCCFEKVCYVRSRLLSESSSYCTSFPKCCVCFFSVYLLPTEKRLEIKKSLDEFRFRQKKIQKIFNTNFFKQTFFWTEISSCAHFFRCRFIFFLFIDEFFFVYFDNFINFFARVLYVKFKSVFLLKTSFWCENQGNFSHFFRPPVVRQRCLGNKK